LRVQGTAGSPPSTATTASIRAASDAAGATRHHAQRRDPPRDRLRLARDPDAVSPACRARSPTKRPPWSSPSFAPP